MFVILGLYVDNVIKIWFSNFVQHFQFIAGCIYLSYYTEYFINQLTFDLLVLRLICVGITAVEFSIAFALSKRLLKNSSVARSFRRNLKIYCVTKALILVCKKWIVCSRFAVLFWLAKKPSFYVEKICNNVFLTKFCFYPRESSVQWKWKKKKYFCSLNTIFFCWRVRYFRKT